MASMKASKPFIITLFALCFCLHTVWANDGSGKHLTRDQKKEIRKAFFASLLGKQTPTTQQDVMMNKEKSRLLERLPLRQSPSLFLRLVQDSISGMTPKPGTPPCLQC